MSGTSLQRAIEAIQSRKLVIVGDTAREMEYDFVGSALLATPETINFMLTHGRGAFIAVFMPEWWADTLAMEKIPFSKALNGTNFRVSVDLMGQMSGSSAYERAATVNALGDKHSSPAIFSSPGHVVPIAAHPNLLKGRRGHTEAGVRLIELSGISPAVAVDIEILHPKGHMAGREHVEELSKRYDIPILDIEDIRCA